MNVETMLSIDLSHLATRNDLELLRNELTTKFDRGFRETELRTRRFTVGNSIAIVGILSALKYFG